MGNEEEIRLNVTLMIPVELHRGWKAICAIKGVSMRDALVQAIKAWVITNSNINLQVEPDDANEASQRTE